MLVDIIKLNSKIIDFFVSHEQLVRASFIEKVFVNSSGLHFNTSYKNLNEFVSFCHIKCGVIGECFHITWSLHKLSFLSQQNVSEM